MWTYVTANVSPTMNRKQSMETLPRHVSQTMYRKQSVNVHLSHVSQKDGQETHRIHTSLPHITNNAKLRVSQWLSAHWVTPTYAYNGKYLNSIKNNNASLKIINDIILFLFEIDVSLKDNKKDWYNSKII